MANNSINLLGKRFGRLIVISRASNAKSRKARWNCICDCGNPHTTIGQLLRNGHTKSCGCLQRETIKTIRLTHGLTGTPAYMSWAGMRGRCHNKNDAAFMNYGGRGITVCKRWDKFENFLEDMGEKPKDLMLDRIDNNQGYSPENCQWATRLQQNNNRRNCHQVTYDGLTLTYSQWSLKLDGNKWLVRCRVREGWSEERAVSTPPNRKCS